MKWLPSKDNFLLYVIILLLIGFIIINIGNSTINNSSPVEEINDTIINTLYVDSIAYRIHYKDSMITKIKYIYEEEIIKARNLNDSSAVELFKDLCTE